MHLCSLPTWKLLSNIVSCRLHEELVRPLHNQDCCSQFLSKGLPSRSGQLTRGALKVSDPFFQ